MISLGKNEDKYTHVKTARDRHDRGCLNKAWGNSDELTLSRIKQKYIDNFCYG